MVTVTVSYLCCQKARRERLYESNYFLQWCCRHMVEPRAHLFCDWQFL